MNVNYSVTGFIWDIEYFHNSIEEYKFEYPGGVPDYIKKDGFDSV